MPEIYNWIEEKKVQAYYVILSRSYILYKFDYIKLLVVTMWRIWEPWNACKIIIYLNIFFITIWPTQVASGQALFCCFNGWPLFCDIIQAVGWPIEAIKLY